MATIWDGPLLPNEMPYCKHDRNIKDGQKKVAFLCRFFRPTSDVNISKSVYPIYLKIKVQRVPTSHSSHINFWVNRITRFRDIDVGSWPKKTTKKTYFFDHPLFIFFPKKSCVFFGRFFRPTSDINISESVYPIYLKINVRWVAS